MTENNDFNLDPNSFDPNYNENNQEIIDPVNENQKEETLPIQTSIAEVSIVPSVAETSNFKALLDSIPGQVAEAKTLLNDYREDSVNFLQTRDEDEIDEVIKNMSDSTKFIRDIDKSKKDIRKYFNTVRDSAMSEIDQRLEAASYGELEKADQDMKQLKKDVSADRQAERWEEIRATFEANVNRYHLIGEFAPELADFSRFKIINSKLISGAKTRNVTEANHTFVNETVYNWNTAIELIKENEWGLSPQDQNQLLTLFKQNPSVDLVSREGRQLKLNFDAREKARAEADEARKKAEEQNRIAEQKRQEEMKRNQEAANAAKLAQDKQAQVIAEQQRVELQKRQAEAKIQEEARHRQLEIDYAEFGGQYQTIFKESFPDFIAYIFQNQRYHDLHTNAQTKASILFDIFQQVTDQNSVVVKETANDPRKILDLARYILDA